MHVMKIDDIATYRIHATFEEKNLLLVTYLGYYASLDNIHANNISDFWSNPALFLKINQNYLLCSIGTEIRSMMCDK